MNDDMNGAIIFIWMVALFSAMISCSIVASSNSVEKINIPKHTERCHMLNEMKYNDALSTIYYEMRADIYTIITYSYRENVKQELRELQDRIGAKMMKIHRKYYGGVQKCKALKKPKK